MLARPRNSPHYTTSVDRRSCIFCWGVVLPRDCHRMAETSRLGEPRTGAGGVRPDRHLRRARPWMTTGFFLSLRCGINFAQVACSMPPAPVTKALSYPSGAHGCRRRCQAFIEAGESNAGLELKQQRRRPCGRLIDRFGLIVQPPEHALNDSSIRMLSRR